MFALPLQVGAARFGALTFYRDRPGPLGEDVLSDALAMADVACEITFGLQAQVPPGSLHQVLDQLANRRTAFYQATGMIVVREVATDVFARRVRFER